MPVLLLLLRHNRCHLPDGLGGVGRPRRIVGRIDEHRRHLLRKHLLKRFQIHLKMLCIRRHHSECGPCQVNIRSILREIGCKRQDLIPRLAHTPHRMGNGARRSRGHENMISRILHPEPFIQRRRHLLPHRRNSQTLAVAVQLHGILFLQQTDHRLRKRLRRRHRRIPQTVIEHILIPDLCTPGRRELRQLPDHRFAL